MSKMKYFKYERGSQVSDGVRVINFGAPIVGVSDPQDIALCEKAKLQEVDAKTAKEMNAMETKSSFSSIEDELGTVKEDAEVAPAAEEKKEEPKKEEKKEEKKTK